MDIKQYIADPEVEKKYKEELDQKLAEFLALTGKTVSELTDEDWDYLLT